MRLRTETESINKNIDNRKHGVKQVRNWLSKREFESDLGFATEALRSAFSSTPNHRPLFEYRRKGRHDVLVGFPYQIRVGLFFSAHER